MPSQSYAAVVGSNPAGTTLRRGAYTPITVTTAANNMKPASAKKLFSKNLRHANKQTHAGGNDFRHI